MEEDLTIQYCPECDWKNVNPKADEPLQPCPYCGTWPYEISQTYHYKKEKLIRKEFNLIDAGENHFYSHDWKAAKKIMDKGFKVFKKEKTHKLSQEKKE